MTYLIMGFTGIIVLIIGIAEIFFRKYVPYIIPLLFLVAFGAIYKSIDYIGYAVDGSLIPDGTEAIVLYQAQSDPWIYYNLMFRDSKEPRLVRMPLTEGNKKENDKSDSSGAIVIRFGKKSTSNSDFSMMSYSDSNLGKK